MKNILIPILFLTACTKEQTTAVNASSTDDLTVKPKVTFIQDEICFDGTYGYKITFRVQRTQPGDLIYAGTTNGTDTLSKVRVMGRDGKHGIQAPTGESGEGVYLYVEIDRADKKFLYQTAGNKVLCTQQ